MQVENIKLFPRLMNILIPRHPMAKFEHTIIKDNISKIYPHRSDAGFSLCRLVPALSS